MSLKYMTMSFCRLLQGAEADLAGIDEKTTLSEEKMIAMKHRLHILEESSKHLIEHIEVIHL